MEAFENIYEFATAISIKINEIFDNGPIKEDEIDWDDILQLCHTYASNFGGFNIFPEKINNYEDFLNLRLNMVDAIIGGNQPLIVRTCRDCGEIFYIYKSEKEFYDEKGLALPKRCKSCRCKRKNIERKMSVATA
jgi:hypothetical protein